MKFAAGLVLGLLLVPAALFLYLVSGQFPVATSGGALPFEKKLAALALHARMDREITQNATIRPNEQNLLAGAKVYQEHCAVCHGLPGQEKTAIAKGMFPPPPQLLDGKRIPETAGENYWKAANGIRLTGMPGFKKSLTEDQLWQVSFVLAEARELPPGVQQFLNSPNATTRQSSAERPYRPESSKN
jgi:mono/diheme cytochrome c family protein